MRCLSVGCLALALIAPTAQGATFQTTTHTISTTVDGLTADIADFTDTTALKGSDETVVHICVTDRRTGESFTFPCDLPVLRDHVVSVRPTLPQGSVASRNAQLLLGLVSVLQVKVNPPGPRPKLPRAEGGRE